MAFIEDPRVFLADFGRPCTLAGAPVTAMVDIEPIEDPDTGVLTQRRVARVSAAEAGAAAEGQSFVDGAASYLVRRVQPEAPDGAFVLLTLART